MNSRPPAEAYCQADPVFYDTGSRAGTDGTAFTQTHGPVPDGWERRDRGVWVVYLPTGHTMPPQGWKIHISGLPDNAQRVVDIATAHCVRLGVPFKFLRSRSVVSAHSLKYAPRSASGKLVTIYPEDETQLRRVLEDLAPALDGEPGPYILTDLRWGNGPLHVRYGGFVTRYCPDEHGNPVPAIERPDGVLVPDRRRPVFDLPDWVALPEFLEPHLAARQSAGQAADFPYTVERALHFSNGGGVYAARHTDGRPVVLKEARPHAGLDGAGTDAVARLHREARAMRLLAGIPGVPELYGHHQVWEHHFLAVEHMPGDTLQAWLARNYPLTRADADDDRLAAYARRALALVDRIEQLVDAVHARGVVFGDLHPANLLVDDEDRVFLVDFELAVPVADADRLGLGHPGFMARGKTGFAIDRHALAALRLWVLFPLTHLSELDPARPARQVAEAERRFGLEPGSLDAVRRELEPLPATLEKVPAALREPAPAGQDWEVLRKSVAQAILLSATPERTDRLFPGDVRQFHTDGLNMAYGAAGVLWALHTSGAGRHRDLERWLLDAAARSTDPRPGFYSGRHGIAHVLEEFGHRDAALRLLDGCADTVPGMRDVSLFHGMAGIGLNLLHFARRTGDTRHRRAALELARRTADAVRAGTAPGIVRGGDQGARAGLLRGWSGPALFFLRLYEDTGDSAHLDLAVTALHHDLDLCEQGADGSLQADAGYRLLPYLEVGGAGIALVADQVLAHRADPRLSEALPALARGAEPEFVIEPHLFAGRAGLLATLASLRGRRRGAEGTVGEGIDPAVARHLARLHWHAMSYRGHIAFPGEQLRRLSMDLATGSAGILLALSAALDGNRGFLPFLAPPPAPRA
ncbi:class III lanthionine synthetase LanKC [Streptomyces sp. XM83C]|uniref:class III lanthionine synthetase LanKC n=1 Tax=unclassified Streptomyces TaxID=2593676 RepID=UPI001FF89545|nr:class III lanthionine synthetase LanKC [Streptomyces sp. XM83C]MCK1820280.1 class III lanthionine synthetase LanKC [Streptomyces sp. XM83C]